MILTDFNLSATEPNSAVALLLELLDIKYFRKSLWLEREKKKKKHKKVPLDILVHINPLTLL